MISYNVGRIAKQLEHFLDFNCGQNSAVLVNNNEWLKKLNYIEFLRDIGKYFSVSFLVNRDYVRSRVIDPDKSITYTELSYILPSGLRLQPHVQRAELYTAMGGNDQQVNIIAGMDLAREKIRRPVLRDRIPATAQRTGTEIRKIRERSRLPVSASHKHIQVLPVLDKCR